MKKIEDIENMSPELLEKIAEDQSIQVPSSLKNDIEAAIIAGSVAEERPAQQKRRFGTKYAAGVSAAAAAACLIVFATMYRPMEDTFDDPLTAYAEIEKTFSYIASKMDKGMEIASEADPVIEKTAKVFNKAKN